MTVVAESFAHNSVPGGGNKTDGLDEDCVVSLPSGTVNNDYLLAAYMQESEATLGALPSAFVSGLFMTVDPTGTSGQHGRIAGKVASSEPSTHTFQMSDDGNAFLSRFSGVNLSDPINASAHTASGSGTSSTPQSPEVTTDVDGCLIIYGLSWAGDSISELVSAPAGTSMIAEGDDAGERPAMVMYAKIQATAGPTGTGDWETSVADRYAAFTIALAPAVAGGVVRQMMQYSV